LLKAGTSRHDLVVMLQRSLAGVALKGTAAIVIDDAQQLQRRTFEQLRALSNLESNAGKLLQIVLIGEPELDARLRRPEAYQLDHRVGCRICLEPLSRNEVGRYIDYRIGAARVDGTTSPRPRFSPSATRMLARVSGRLPRALNALCDRSLQIGFEERADQITRRIVLRPARLLRLPIPITARYPLARDLAAAIAAVAILTLPLVRLERSVYSAFTPLFGFQTRAAAQLYPHAQQSPQSAQSLRDPQGPG